MYMYLYYQLLCDLFVSCRYEVLGGNSQRLVMGVFSIAPAFGVIGPGLSQTISVECIAEKGGKHEEVQYMHMYKIRDRVHAHVHVAIKGKWVGLEMEESKLK